MFSDLVMCGNIGRNVKLKCLLLSDVNSFAWSKYDGVKNFPLSQKLLIKHNYSEYSGRITFVKKDNEYIQTIHNVSFGDASLYQCEQGNSERLKQTSFQLKKRLIHV